MVSFNRRDTQNLKDELSWNNLTDMKYLLSENVRRRISLLRTFVVIWPLARPKMPFQGDAPEGRDTF